MNAVEIEEAASLLAGQMFDHVEFPFAFLAAFGNKDTTIKRLRVGNNNASDVKGGVLQRSNIHMAVSVEGAVTGTLQRLRESPRTTAYKVRFILATDGKEFQAEDLVSGETIVCEFEKFADHFGFFLPLAGITTVKQIRENAFDIRATGRLNRLYLQLLSDNPEWGAADRRHDMNHFMARLIFCFFAEDTGIFNGEGLFTRTIEQMSDRNSSNTHEVIERVFAAMNTSTMHDGRPDDRYRRAANTPRWADVFPYVNGGLFSGSLEVPRFSRIARSYFLHIGSLDWKQINPDIFGSMIQAVADEDERGELGMHYTSVPNILKVLNPLFLDDLRVQLETAGSNARALLNLRKRLSRIRVFDPACGSGNFLVIAYKEMRALEAEINRRRGETDRRSDIPLTNFRGIELRDFAAEIARLALIIAEYQADVLYRGQKEALAAFLPLDAQNWITCGNALRLDWLAICPPMGAASQRFSSDLFEVTSDAPQIEFENEGGETYLCGNPPYVGDKFQTDDQKRDLQGLSGAKSQSKAVDYIAGWFWKAADYIGERGAFAFVSTNSICQGVQVPTIWREILSRGQQIFFAYLDFYWQNNASNNANVICVIVGVERGLHKEKYIYSGEQRKVARHINAYLVDGPDIIIDKRNEPLADLPQMFAGNIPRDKGNFMLTPGERGALIREHPDAERLVKRILGSAEFINGIDRFCLWISDDDAELAFSVPEIRTRLDRVIQYRRSGSERGKLGLETPYKFERTITANENSIIVPRVSSERREYIPVGFLSRDVIISDAAQAIYDAPLYILSILSSKMHMAWVGLTAGRMKSDYRYSAGVVYNTFPMPALTEQNRSDLEQCAQEILLVREAHFPATLGELYDPDDMPDDLRQTHNRNDETVERIYAGRRFRNDTDRLEKLFDLYAEMIAGEAKTKGMA